jgi:hypothetical protein
MWLAKGCWKLLQVLLLVPELCKHAAHAVADLAAWGDLDLIGSAKPKRLIWGASCRGQNEQKVETHAGL